MATSRFGHLVSPSQSSEATRPATAATAESTPAVRIRPITFGGTAPKDAVPAAAPKASGFRPAGPGIRVQSNSDAFGTSSFRGQASYDSSVKFSEEQDAIIQSPARLIVTKAFAGAGKTTTAVGYAKRRPGMNILYMPFGKSVQLEAVKRFPPNTTCQTINSAAYAATPQLRHKLQNLSPLVIRNEMDLATNRQAGIALNILNQFMVSADPDIRISHAQNVMERWRASDSEVADAIAVAKLAWRRMKDPSDKMPLSHDTLLKIWSLTNPRLNYDAIIFDEYQDTNPVTAHIVKQQTHAIRLYIGDPHQSIYRFRGAVNGMEEIAMDPAAKLFHLSQTWRFGPKIAEIANTILSELKGETVKIQGMGKDYPWEAGATITKLSRTNAQLFREAVLTRGEGVHWIGKNGIKDYNVDQLLQAYAMYKGRMSEVTDPLLRNFRSWSEAEAYAEDAKDGEVGILVKLIEEYRDDIPDLVRDLKLNEVKNEADAKVRLTTAHRAKGLDWDYVQICDDMNFLEKIEEKLAEDPYADIDDQEINLLYVAATRGKKCVLLNPDTITWIENLDEHRAARLQAKRRVDERRAAARSFLERPAA